MLLEGEATDILNDHHPGKLVHNILQTVTQKLTAGSFGPLSFYQGTKMEDKEVLK
jgi:uncharacterized protein (DUF2249 family)